MAITSLCGRGETTVGVGFEAGVAGVVSKPGAAVAAGTDGAVLEDGAVLASCVFSVVVGGRSHPESERNRRVSAFGYDLRRESE
jgi:hypothetical protein